jgi:hypothetical protein
MNASICERLRLTQQIDIFDTHYRVLGRSQDFQLRRADIRGIRHLLQRKIILENIKYINF